ncbi:MAG: ATP-grasp domain-containing protein [Fuerstiella sp.]|nr:ATP-grasp domain-containing protein [Fuerstiella sp.]
MQRLLIFEVLHASAEEFTRTSPAMRCEGRAMLDALLTDAVALHDTAVSVLVCETALATFDNMPDSVAIHCSADQSSWPDELAGAARDCDFVLPVAPECEGLLLRAAQTLYPLSCTTLLPSVSTVEICSDKWKTWKLFGSSDTPMVDCAPVGAESTDARFSDPQFVYKPRFGAGCDGIRRGRLPFTADPYDYIRQPKIFGQSLSVGVLGGPRRVEILPVAEQRIVWTEDRPWYSGGSIPADIPHEIARRVSTIARHVIERIGDFQGYIGMDFLVSRNDGTIYLNEINPRVCTSYFGYRQLLPINPLELVLNEVECPPFASSLAPIRFEIGEAGMMICQS